MRKIPVVTREQTQRVLQAADASWGGVNFETWEAMIPLDEKPPGCWLVLVTARMQAGTFLVGGIRES